MDIKRRTFLAALAAPAASPLLKGCTRASSESFEFGFPGKESPVLTSTNLSPAQAVSKLFDRGYNLVIIRDDGQAGTGTSQKLAGIISETSPTHLFMEDTSGKVRQFLKTKPAEEPLAAADALAPTKKTGPADARTAPLLTARVKRTEILPVDMSAAPEFKKISTEIDKLESDIRFTAYYKKVADAFRNIDSPSRLTANERNALSESVTNSTGADLQIFGKKLSGKSVVADVVGSMTKEQMEKAEPVINGLLGKQLGKSADVISSMTSDDINTLYTDSLKKRQADLQAARGKRDRLVAENMSEQVQALLRTQPPQKTRAIMSISGDTEPGSSPDAIASAIKQKLPAGYKAAVISLAPLSSGLMKLAKENTGDKDVFIGGTGNADITVLCEDPKDTRFLYNVRPVATMPEPHKAMLGRLTTTAKLDRAD